MAVTLRSLSRLVLPLFFLATVDGEAGAEDIKSAEAPGPRIVFSSTRRDLGTVSKAETVRTEFLFKNGGNSDLEIREVKASCGCAVPRFDRVVKPGAEGKIDLAIDAKGFDGIETRSVIVVSNDPRTPQVVLSVRAIAKSLVTAVPPGFFRLEALTGQTAKSEVLLSSEDPAFNPGKAEVPESYLVAEISPVPSAAPGPKSFRVVLTLSLDAPDGVLGGAVKVPTGIAGQPEYAIPVSGFIKAAVSVSTEFISFQNFEFKGNPVQRDLLVTNNDRRKTGFAVLKAEVSGAKIKADVVRVNADQVRIVLTVDPRTGKGEFEGMLHIVTNHATKTDIRVPVQGVVF